jgi:zinc D-Ala-D-Ala carboxypeptidase
LTPHFSRSEVECRCGCGMLPKQDFMDKVEALRVAYGKPLAVTSAARCPNHNARVSATGRTGPHTTGRAIDLAVDRGNAYRLLRMALEAGFSGLGFQQKGAGRFLHLDDLPNAPGQPRPTVWSY